MKVALLSHTPNPETLVAQSAKLCYSSSNIDDILSNLSDDEIRRFVEHLVSLNHESPLEHINFTFGIEGVSRSLTHQLVRHRLFSFSQQSQRYVKLNDTNFIVPISISSYNEAQIEFDKAINQVVESYQTLIDLGIPKEDARSILPNATPTKIIMTMNARSLLNFFELRCCVRAESEIRKMANIMLRQIKEIAPTIFKMAGATCERGYCKEGSMTCGRLDNINKNK